MFCSDCGTENREDTKFCVNCGNCLKPQNTNYYENNIQPVSPAVGTIKRLASSQLFLAAVILFSAAILFSIAYAVTARTTIIQMLYSLGRELNLGADYYALIQSIPLRGEILYSALSGQIFAILTAAGLWMIYASAKDKSTIGVKTAGFTMIKVVNIIGIVIMSIAAVVVIVAAVVAFAATSYYFAAYDSYYQDEYISVALAVLLIMVFAVIIGVAFSIVFYARVLATINSAKRTIETGVSSGKASGFVGVMCYIIGIIVALNSVSAIAFLGVFGVLSTLCDAAALIIFGIILFKYRSAQKLNFAPVFSGAMPAAQYAPVPASEPVQAKPTAAEPTAVPAPTVEEQAKQTEQAENTEEIPAYVYCPNCGAKNDRESTFCANCGGKLK